MKNDNVMSQSELEAIKADIQKGYDELMKENQRITEWMKSVGLTK
jgi:hypothetical protein